MKNNKKGSAFVEASLIYPVIIVITLMMMSVSLFFYSINAQISDMNRCVRRTAGEESGTVFYGEDVQTTGGGFVVTCRNGLLSETVRAESGRTFYNTVLFAVGGTLSPAAQADVVCEVDLLRAGQGIRDLIK